MNNIKTTDIGGFPIVLDDWRFGIGELQDFINLNASFGLERSYIIKGCQLTDNGSSYTLTDGYCYLNGEIRRVRGGTIAKGSNITFVIKEVNELADLNIYPSSEKEFKDQSTNYVYEVRESEFGSVASGSSTSGMIVLAVYNFSLAQYVLLDNGMRAAMAFATRTAPVAIDNAVLGAFNTAGGFSPSTETSRIPRFRLTNLGIQLSGSVMFDCQSNQTADVDIFTFTPNLFFSANPVIFDRISHQPLFSPSLAATFNVCTINANNRKLTLAASKQNITITGMLEISLDGIMIDV